MIVEEKTIQTERIYEGKILNLRRDEVTIRDGKTSMREIVEHNGGVVVAALTKEGKLPLVRQFRKAAEKAVVELPAGKLERDEDPEKAALRELKEETGYVAGRIEFLTAAYSSIGYSTEVLHIYMAWDLTPGETEFDEGEAMDNLEVPLAEAFEMALRGEIEDAKTIVGIMMVNERENRRNGTK